MRIGTTLMAGIIFLASCRTTGKIEGTSRPSITSLKFLDSTSIPYYMNYRGTIVGGLSGIDYVPSKNIYYMICDDPSALSPARFYTAQISITGYSMDSVSIVAVDSVWNPAGKLYPDIRKDRPHSADLESMRYNPVNDELIRTSEGQRVLNDSTHHLQNPDIVIMERNGHYRDSITMPANIRVYENGNRGLRHNMTLEGITFVKNHREFLVSVEDALYEDGPSARTGDSTAWTRLLLFDRNKKRQIAQFAYQIDPIPYPANPPGAFKVNGISDILSVGNDRLLVLERAWSTGRTASDIRVYLADYRKASDISGNNSLVKNPARKPVSKKLVLNMESLGFTTYNIEGMTFGPDLPNGHHTLIFVSDDNFLKDQQSQFLLFEVIP